MFITKELMECTWYLKKDIRLNHKWAFSSAFELSAMPKSFTLIIHTPGSPFNAWSSYNIKNVCAYFIHLSRDAAGSLADDLVNAVLKLRKLERECRRVDINSVASIRGGELAYYVLRYYAASKTDTFTNKTLEFDHLPSWGLPPI